MKTIHFDIDLARKGAKVVTETGLDVTIVNFNCKIGEQIGRPILARYGNSNDEVYELWPKSGTFEDGVGRPPDLRIVKTERYRCNGPSIYDAFRKKNNFGDDFFFNVEHGGMAPGELGIIADQVVAALNLADENVSEVDYEDEENPVVTMSREDWVRVRERTELLETENKALGEENHTKSRQILILEDEIRKNRYRKVNAEEVRKWAADCNEKQKTIDELERWKKEALESFKKWDDVTTYLHTHFNPTYWGRSIQDIVLKKLRDTE